MSWTFVHISSGFAHEVGWTFGPPRARPGGLMVPSLTRTKQRSAGANHGPPNFDEGMNGESELNSKYGNSCVSTLAGAALLEPQLDLLVLLYTWGIDPRGIGWPVWLAMETEDAIYGPAPLMCEAAE